MSKICWALLLIIGLGLSGCAPTRQRFTIAPPPTPSPSQKTAATSNAQAEIPPGGRNGRLNENQCIEVFMENIAMTHAMRNRCDFAVNVVFGFNEPGVEQGLPQGATQIYLAPNGGQVLDIIRHNPRASISYWACHGSQVPVWRGTRPSTSPGGRPRDVWRCEGPPG